MQTHRGRRRAASQVAEALVVEKGAPARVDLALPSHLERVVTLEVALHLGAVLLAFLLRLAFLDSRPLSVEEGGLAAESYRVWQGQQVAPLHQGPLLAYGGALLLAMFGGGDGPARLLPVLFGSLLVAVPYLLRHELGRLAALVAAYGLAFSPLMLFASRDVGSGIVPVALGGLLWWWMSPGLKSVGRYRAYAAALSLSGILASGTEGASTIVALALAVGLSHPRPSSLLGELRQAAASPAWRRAAMVFVGGALAIATGFGANLSGVQAVVVDVWAGFFGSFSLAAPRDGLLFLALYELPALALGLAQLVRTIWRRERVDMFLALWAMLLLLLGMLQSTSAVPRSVLPLLPLYLLAARLVADGLRAGRGWSWGRRSIGVASAVAGAGLVATVILNAASLPGNERFIPYLLVAVGIILVGEIAASVHYGRRGEGAVVWGGMTVLLAMYLVHGAAFLNYRADTFNREPVLGTQVSSSLRQAASDLSYYSAYFNARVQVDPQMRATTEWYLRTVREIQPSAEQSSGVGIAWARTGQESSKSGGERRAGTYAPAFDPGDITWQGVWRWLVVRDGLVRENRRDIIVRAPAGSW